MNTATATTILVPGAWMGAWIWEPTAQALTARGIDAKTITLRGLEPEQPESTIAGVRLEDHVQQLVDYITAVDPRPVVLVSHSYSAMPAALAAARLDGHVQGLIHFGGFLPVDGRSLLDDWGGSGEDREQERADITAAGNLWLPPARQMLDVEPYLAPANRDFLAKRFTPHPGHTITDPARLFAPVGAQPSTYVALSSIDDEEEAWKHAPGVAKDALNWRRKHLRSGHWPMISVPEATTKLLAEEIGFYSAGSM